jgi:hypothetical protein
VSDPTTDRGNPAPQEGEFVVFIAHFERGFRLPASPFFWDFCRKYRLQSHHMAPNLILALSAFATVCQPYLGVWPTVDLWSAFYTMHPHTVQNPDKDTARGLAQCGGCSSFLRSTEAYFGIKGLDSVKLWQRSYFYVKVKTTENGVVVAAPSDPNLLDWINLPAFTVRAPADKTHWKYDSKASLQGVALEQITDQIERLNTLKESGLSAEDILFALVERRVLPL